MTPKEAIFDSILSKLKDQSLVVLLLALVTFYFYDRTEKLESLVVDCQNQYRNTLMQFLNEQKATYRDYRRPQDDFDDE